MNDQNLSVSDSTESCIAFYLNTARNYIKNQNFGKAYAFYLLVVQILPDLKDYLKDEYCICWRHWSTKLCNLGKHKELFDCYRQGCDNFLDCDMFHVIMGNNLYDLGFKYGAIGMFRRALTVNKNCFAAKENLENTCRGLVESWHFPMLNDMDRNQKFCSAISKAIENSKKHGHRTKVLDIGSGTSILSMCAAKFGAEKIHSCEMSNIMHMIAEDVIKQNDLYGHIDLINCKSTELVIKDPYHESININTLSTKVSMVITETVDAGLFGEGIIETLNHAWKNLLIPPSEGGVVVPSHANVYCKIIQSDEIHSKHVHSNGGMLQVLCYKIQSPKCFFTFRNNVPSHKQKIYWTSAVGILDIDHLNEFNNNANFYCTSNPEPYTSEKLSKILHLNLSNAVKVISVNFNDPSSLKNITSNNISCSDSEVTVSTCGYLDAVALYFDLFLDQSGTLVINTDEDSSNCWEQAVYPIRKISMHSQKNNINCKWCANVIHDCDRIIVHKDQKVIMKFSPKLDRLQLECISVVDKNYVRNFSQILKDVSDQSDVMDYSIIVSESDIMRLNNHSTQTLYYEAIKTFHKKINKSKINILDMSEGISPVSIKCWSEFQSEHNFSIFKCWHDDKTETALIKLLEILGYNKSILMKSVPEQSDLKFDLIIADIIEPSGLLRSQVLENLAMAKMHLNQNGIVYPLSIKMWIQCISSDELCSKCMVNDDNCLGFQIGEFINDFQVSTYCNLDCGSLEMRLMSGEYVALELNFNVSNSFLSKSNKFKVVISKGGVLTAILSWFEIQIDEHTSINTSHSENYWRQAAIIIPYSQQQNFVAGDVLEIEAACKNSFLKLAVKKENKIPV